MDVRAKLGGKQYRVRLVARHEMAAIGWRSTDGLCQDPQATTPEIWIYNRLSGRRKLEVLIHEALHAADWTKDESWISQTALEIAIMLWKLNYREREKK